jgi:hypothetical protein
MKLVPLDLECSPSRLRENMEVFYFYQRLLFLQSSSLSIASSNSIQQEINERARDHLSNCLNILTKPKYENNGSLYDDFESLLIASFRGFHSFASHQFIQAGKYSFQELLPLSATHRFSSELILLPLLYQHYELILFSQLLFLNNLQSAKDFLGNLLQQSEMNHNNRTEEEGNYFQLEEERFFTNFLFLCHLIEGKLFLWDFSEGNEESTQNEKSLVFKECSKEDPASIYCRFPIDEKSFESVYLRKFRREGIGKLLLMRDFMIFYERFAAFHQIYSTPFPAEQHSSSVQLKIYQNPFQDLLQKYENILKKIQSFSQRTTESSGKLHHFYRDQYHPMYTNMIVLNYLNLGLSDYSWKYFENQFLFSIASRGLFDSDLSSIEEVVENKYETVLRSFFPENQISNTVLQYLVSCEQIESFYKNSSLFRTAFDLYTFLQPKGTTTPAGKRTIERNQRIETLLTEPFLFNNYMMILSQTMNPMILSSVPVSAISDLSNDHWSWVSEALLYRLFFVNILDTLNEYCSSGVGSSTVVCRQFNDDTLSVLVRGFFLEAYQGVNLLEQFYRKYYEMVGSTTGLTAVDEEENSVYQNLLFPKLKDYSTTTRFLQLMNSSQFFSSPVSTSQTKKKEQRPYRIGIVCYSLSRHSVGRLMAKVIDSLQADHEFFELFIFTNQAHSISIAASFDHSHFRNPLTASDDITKYLMQIIPSSHWIDLTTRSSSSSSLSFSSSKNPIGERIKSFQLDLLIYTDLLMQSSQYSFAYSERYAETQVIFWGHPYTTSNPFIDYYITSSLFEPSNPNLVRNDQFTEQLIYFDSLSFQLFPPLEGTKKEETPIDQKYVEEEKVEVTPQSLKGKYHWELIQNRKIFLQNTLSNAFTLQGNLYSSQYNYRDFIRAFSKINVEKDGNEEEKDENDFLVSLHFYGALQSLMKMHPLFDSMILQLLQKDSHAVIFLLKNTQQFHWQLNWQKRLFQGLSSYNLTYDDVKHRLFFVPPMKSTEYSQFLCSLDIILDSFPFGGGVTMCDAIAGNCVNRVQPDQNQKKIPTSDSMERYEKYYSIPFISMNDLQSIHRIGIGIAQRVNRSDFTTIIEDKRHSIDQIIDYMEKKKMMKNSTKNKGNSVLELFHEYTQELMEEYVEQAMELVHHSNERYLRSLPQPSLRESSSEAVNVNDPYWAIYEDTHTTEEWKQFLKRILT